MSFNWNQAAEYTITTILGEIPEVGGILSGLVEIFWPESQEDVWDQIKSQVEALIGQAISQEVYSRVQTSLGTVQEQNGLIGDIDNYLGSIASPSNGQDPQTTWTAVNGNFIDSSASFEQSGYEVLLLPLFAQMANMHIALLRDGVVAKYCALSELQLYLKLYTNWANQWVITAVDRRSSTSKGLFNPINRVQRFMQLNVGNFSGLWPYFDLSVYPNPVKNISFPQEIFYTFSEILPASHGTVDGVYPVPGALFGSVSQIDIAWLNSNNGPWTMVMGSQLKYDSGLSTSYSGALADGKPPSNGQQTYIDGTWGIVNTSTNTTNPIVAVNGLWDDSGYIASIQFIFKDGTLSSFIPPYSDGSGDSTFTFAFSVPSGYSLSSIWVPSQSNFYEAPADVVFGFQWTRSAVVSPGLTDTISCDPKQWVADCPVAGSLNWVTGYTVQYAIAWIYNDGTLSNLGPWCAINPDGPWAEPTLLLSPTTNPSVVGRQIWRKFAGKAAELVGTIDNITASTYADVMP